MMLCLVILRKGEVLESALICWNDVCVKKIIPNRAPQLEVDGKKVWVIDLKKRPVFCRFVDQALETHAKKDEGAYGFFGLRGIHSRWYKDVTVDWGIVVGDVEVKKGDILKEKKDV